MTVAVMQGIAMKTTGVHHVALRSTDLARAKVFYIERLGFPLLLESEDLFLFLAGATAIGVRGPTSSMPSEDTFDPFRVGLDHLALGCTDAHELHRVAAALTQAGVEHTGVKTDTLLHKDYVAFKDPDGIKWELYTADDPEGVRRATARSVVDAYFAALTQRDFDAIPYADDVMLRAPLVPGGAANALSGRETLRTVWWQPLLPALDRITIRVIDYYVNTDATAVCAAAEITLPAAKAVLRVVDRFRIDSDGRITEQENHFDPRAVTA